MSRCFPFPPPGYESKIRAEQAHPLSKEKQKEKKHNKDKDRGKDKQKKHKDRKDKDKDKPLEEKNAQVLTNTVQNNSNGEIKYVQDLATRIRYEEATGSQSARNSGVTDKTFENSSFCLIRETNYRDDDYSRIIIEKNFAMGKSSENAVAQVLFGADQKRVVAMGKLMESRDLARQTESSEKNHHKESATKRDISTDKEGVKRVEAQVIDRNKEKKDEKTELLNKTCQEKPKLIGGPKLLVRAKDSLDIRNCKPPPDLSLMAERNLCKRKDLETNGFLYESGTTQNKLQRDSASVQSVKNGRTLGSQRTPPVSASEVQGTMGKPEIKELRINGFVAGEKRNICPPDPLAATMKVKVKENGEASAKPYHPDLKYLNQVLNVPKELLVEVDGDQGWLLGPAGVKLKKARTYFHDLGESLQVWNQALMIEAADIVALPYVVPF